MDLTRWTNVTRARRAFEARFGTAGKLPIEAFFEVSARCNLRCVMCAINVDQRYRSGSGRPAMLEPEVFEKLRPAFPTLIRTYLFGLGEPLLNRHLCDYARALDEAGSAVWFNTNGTLIDEATADELALAGVEAVTVSLDGATAATYERIRRGASFDAVLGGFRALRSARHRHGRPRVDVSFVAMASNLPELPALVELCEREGIGTLHVEPLFAQQNDELGGLYDEQNLGRLRPSEVDAIFDDTARRAESSGVALSSRFLAERCDPDYLRHSARRSQWWRCSEPWTSIWVTTAGEVRCCCLNDTVFGSLTTDSLAAIWNGPAFRAFRSRHASGEPPASCRNCYRNGRVRMSPYFAAVEPVTFRPLARETPSPPTSEELWLQWPGPNAIVTDPLVVAGRVPDAFAQAAEDLQVVIDRTVVATLRDGAALQGPEFLLSIPVPYLTEGAHLLRLRPARDPAHPGWAGRTIHCWRPDTDADIRVAEALALPAITSRLGLRPRITIDRRAVRCQWFPRTRHRRTSGLALIDTSWLAPGPHELRIESVGRAPHVVRLSKLETTR